MKTINELIKMYDNELRALMSNHNAKDIMSITNVMDRTEALAIHRFLYNLKNLPNESKTVNRNEQKEKVYCAKCQIEFHNRKIFLQSDRDKELT
jgi:thiamine pyrophosphokinase